MADLRVHKIHGQPHQKGHRSLLPCKYPEVIHFDFSMKFDLSGCPIGSNRYRLLVYLGPVGTVSSLLPKFAQTLMADQHYVELTLSWENYQWWSLFGGVFEQRRYLRCQCCGRWLYHPLLDVFLVWIAFRFWTVQHSIPVFVMEISVELGQFQLIGSQHTPDL